MRLSRAEYRGGGGAVSCLGKGCLGTWQELPWIAGDEACPTLKGYIGPYPGQHHEHTITKPDEEEEVNGHPGKPGEEPGKLEPSKIRYCCSAPNGRQGALVPVMKWCVGLAGQGASEAVRRMAPALNGCWRDSGYGFAVGHGRCQVSNDKDLGMSRDGKIVLHLDAAGPVKWNPQAAG